MDYNAQHLAIKTTQIRQFITYRNKSINNVLRWYHSVYTMNSDSEESGCQPRKGWNGKEWWI